MLLLSLIFSLVVNLVAQYDSHLQLLVFIMTCGDTWLLDMSEGVCFLVKIRLNSSRLK